MQFRELRVSDEAVRCQGGSSLVQQDRAGVLFPGCSNAGRNIEKDEDVRVGGEQRVDTRRRRVEPSGGQIRARICDGGADRLFFEPLGLCN